MLEHDKIAIVGNGTTTRESDNFDGQIWTTASVAKILPRVDKVFEVHKEYDAKRLNGYKCPVMTDGEKSDIDESRDLDIDGMAERHGAIFQFSFDYMLAHAVDIGVKSITLYGIDLTHDSEYGKFRQSFFYWVGFCRGRGITVDISEGSLIFNRRWVYPRRDELADVAKKLAETAEAKIKEFEEKTDDARLQLAYSNGYRQCALDMTRAGV
jgi:hypothetical protein